MHESPSYYTATDLAYPAPAGETGPNREITITPLHYGYFVKIGCQEFAFETSDKMILHLSAYLKDPIKAKDDWFRDKKLP